LRQARAEGKSHEREGASAYRIVKEHYRASGTIIDLGFDRVESIVCQVTHVHDRRLRKCACERRVGAQKACLVP